MSGPDLPPEGVVALGGEVERTSRRVEKVEALVQQLAADVHTLATHVADQSSSPSRVRSWLEIDDPELARIVLADLIVWLERVYLRYADAVLPSCWLWHPDVVEELWCLRNTHRDAITGRDASWLRLQDWQDRSRPGVARRVREAAGKCELSLHTEGGEKAPVQPGVPFAASAELIAEVWTGQRSAPLPTDEQLDEAQLQHAPDQRKWSGV